MNLFSFLGKEAFLNFLKGFVPEGKLKHGTVHALITLLSCTDQVTAHALMTWLIGH